MSKTDIIFGAVFSVACAICVEVDWYSGATYWGLSAIGMWMSGIAQAIKDSRKP